MTPGQSPTLASQASWGLHALDPCWLASASHSALGSLWTVLSAPAQPAPRADVTVSRPWRPPRAPPPGRRLWSGRGGCQCWLDSCPEQKETVTQGDDIKTEEARGPQSSLGGRLRLGQCLQTPAQPQLAGSSCPVAPDPRLGGVDSEGADKIQVRMCCPGTFGLGGAIGWGLFWSPCSQPRVPGTGLP